MVKKRIKYLALVLMFTGCTLVGDVKIRDYIKLGEGDYLVSYSYQALFFRTDFKFTRVSFSDESIFYKSDDQHSILFEIGDYEKIVINSDSILVFTTKKPSVFIKDHRIKKFVFKTVD